MKKITLGIVGGGQLGRMSALAAANLGIETVIYCPETDSPASQVVKTTINGDYDNQEQLRAFADQVDYISYEFENIPVHTVEFLENHKPVYPKAALLEVSQDRVEEKSFLNNIGIPTARWSAPKTPQDALKTLEEWQQEQCIFKTTRFGYDGKGQARYTVDTDIETLWTQFKDQPLIMEEMIDFDCEISVIVGRDLSGQIIHYGPMLNEHKDHILSKTTLPAPLDDTIANEAIRMAEQLAEKIDLQGVLTLELFVTKDGKLLANEIAPRTHNSGHWSIDACAHSQFENHVRAVCDMPVLEPARHSDCDMLNLIGDDINLIEQYKTQSKACIHLYGKLETRPGRKMGHITILK